MAVGRVVRRMYGRQEGETEEVGRGRDGLVRRQNEGRWGTVEG